MKIFRGRKSVVGCIVELDNDGYTTQLSLERSLRVIDHSPDGFQWGYNGSGSAQLAAAILCEVTGDADLTCQYYQFFKFDHVTRWQDTFEINEFQVREWLRNVGGVQISMADKAITEFAVFNQLYEVADRRWRKASAAGQGHRVLEAILSCKAVISLTRDWVRKYKPHIQELRPATEEAFGWMPMIEEIRNRLRQFRILLSYRQVDQSQLEVADQIREEVEVLLEKHIYLPEV